MAGEVEFRDDDFPINEAGEFEQCRNRVLRDPCLEVLDPLAYDVVGYEDTGGSLCDQR